MEKITEILSTFLTKIFGSRNERYLRSKEPVIQKIDELEPAMIKLQDREFALKTIEFKERLLKGETLDGLLPEAFALVREAGRRTIGLRHFKVQLIGGIVLHEGKIAEMATGEGKTLVATLAAYLNALPGKGVHVVTVNDYLARRDTQWMGPIYDILGLKVACIQGSGEPVEAYLYDKDFNNSSEDPRHNLRPISKKEAYLADITYGTNNEFGFDYLRDNMQVELDDQVQRELNYAIVDEVDNILIDEARTPLIISGPAEESTEKYYSAEKIARKLNKNEDYIVKEKENTVILTEKGIEKVEKALGITSMYLETTMDWPHLIEQALRAKELFKKDKDYIVKDGEVIIVDEFTGRLMPGRRWSDGLHQAVEAKEHLNIREENQTLATITLQNYFRLYKKLAGMTGTAATEAAEFMKIYNLEVIVIPTNKPLIRYNYPDIIFATVEDKFRAVVNEIERLHKEGRPVLVGSTSIEDTERMSKLLKKKGIKHEVLNAKHHEREAMIIAKAGQMGAVTISTNMAGRGTDIVLGEGVSEKGGLHVIGTVRHEARRIDNQLRGRAGRQGDPGSSQFFVSLEDELLRVFAPEWVRAIMQKYTLANGQGIQSKMITKALEKAQKKMEEHNFDIRKNLLEYDEVLNEQRKSVYSIRQKILRGEGLKEIIFDMLEDKLYDAMDVYMPKKVSKAEWDFDGFVQYLTSKFGIEVGVKEIEGKRDEDIISYIMGKLEQKYNEHERVIGAENFKRLQKIILLDRIDAKWKEQLYIMDHLRSSVGLRSYAHLNPKLEYKRESLIAFNQMWEAIRNSVTELIFKLRLQDEKTSKVRNYWQITSMEKAELKDEKQMYQIYSAENSENKEEEKGVTIIGSDKIGRNEPCPCGSGKKYKKCCGRKVHMSKK